MKKNMAFYRKNEKILGDPILILSEIIELIGSFLLANNLLSEYPIAIKYESSPAQVRKEKKTDKITRNK